MLSTILSSSGLHSTVESAWPSASERLGANAPTTAMPSIVALADTELILLLLVAGGPSEAVINPAMATSVTYGVASTRMQYALT